MSNLPILSAVICTHNRPKLLLKCLKSLLNQTASNKEYEILIVDNASTKDTELAVKDFVDNHFVRYVYEPVIGLSRARNCGWQNAKGKYIGYIDDDARSSKKWVASAITAFEMLTPTPDWVGGPIFLDWEKPKPDWIKKEMCLPLGNVYWGDKPCKIDKNKMLGGGNSVFLKTTLEKLSGFEERLGRKGNFLLSGEEIQFKRRVEENNGSIFYHPNIAIWHNVPAERMTPQWFYRRYYWGGISDYIIGKTLSINDKSGGEIENCKKLYVMILRFKRFIKNLLYGIGLAPSEKKRIWGRVYLSYCIGYLIGGTKHMKKYRQ